MDHNDKSERIARLGDVAVADRRKILNPNLADCEKASGRRLVLVVLAAGKGTRFGPAPKCAQLVCGVPLARHTIDAFRSFSPSPVICVVGYAHETVAEALGNDVIQVLSDNPVGGTGYAVFEAFSVPWLLETNPLLIIAMGDRIIPEKTFRRLCAVHFVGQREADLTFLTAIHPPPANKGKGRILRRPDGTVAGIAEQRDIDAIQDSEQRMTLDSITECNCPLYAIRARVLHRVMQEITNANAQRQFYITDIIGALAGESGNVRTLTVEPADPVYALLAADVTRPGDLARLENVLTRNASASRTLSISEINDAAQTIALNRPPAQIAAIARQIRESVATAAREEFGFEPDRPVAIGMAGGRFRIAFMHPDMGRFYGPAWQMPIGAGSPEGEEQVLIIAQCSHDRFIHLFPTNAKYKENAGAIPATTPEMFPDAEVIDCHSYEVHGTRMSENLLVQLGYIGESDLQRMRETGRPLPPESRWVAANMRHPFPLVCNALVSIRTLRNEPFAQAIRETLGPKSFPGLRVICAGNIPQGGFSSSSAVTVAAQNAISALFDLRIPPDILVNLACQAEYGTGVRAGSLDQATEQKGLPGVGTLISSNPRDNYRVLATYPVPTGRFKIIFPYSVERDKETWRWSWGVYGRTTDAAQLTSGEIRKLTGKAAEIAAILLHLPLEIDFFKQIESDLLDDGLLSFENRRWITMLLRQLPMLISKDELRTLLAQQRGWYVAKLIESEGLPTEAAACKADATFSSLLAGWRNPTFTRATSEGKTVAECGVPLRSMVAYLFAEVARNFRLIHNTDQWIYWVTWSQRGDRCVEINPEALPDRSQLEQPIDWEKGCAGPDLLNLWLDRIGARRFNFQGGLSDDQLDPDRPPAIELIEGACFFRGLALIDLAEAMLKRAFGADAVAVRINGAGQGDYFQVHIDTQKAGVDDVKHFIRLAFYRRFGLNPNPEFVEVHPGGGAFGVRLARYDMLNELADELARRAQLPAQGQQPGVAFHDRFDADSSQECVRL